MLSLGFTLCLLGSAISTAQAGGISYSTASSGRKQCTVHANGGNFSDVANILKAFSQCGQGGQIVFPEDQNYFIASKLNPVVNDVLIDWQGTWTFSPDINSWRNNTYPIAFQNHWASFVLTGDHITINGHGTGGIHGNGNAWYNEEKAITQPGRPMPFVLWNVSDVTVTKFFVKDPPLWSFNIINGTNIVIDELYCNATAVNAPYGSNWVQNTDGFDTLDVNNVKLTNFVYQGGDDCIAIKPRSYNVQVRNATCRGGNGMAIGSLGQYLENSSVENIIVDDVKILTYNNDMHNSAYIKTWMGGLVPQSSYESAGLPRGGGWGVVKNVVFSNFYIEGASSGPSITQNNGDNGSYSGTSKMELSNIAFVNFTGYLAGNGKAGSVGCSKLHPCYNIAFQNITLLSSQNATSIDTSVLCSLIASNGVSLSQGLVGSGC